MLCPSCNTPNRDDAKFCKKCGQSLHIGAPQVPEVAAVSQVSTPVQEHMDAEDPSVTPTQIISPQKMLEFHNRRWQQELEREQTTATPKSKVAASDEEVIPAQLSTSPPGALPVGDEAEPDIADMPTLLINSSMDSEHISIPPPPPPTSTDAAIPAQMLEASTDESTPILPPPEVAEVASTPVEMPETETVEAVGAVGADETNQEQPAGAAKEEIMQDQTATTQKEEEDGVTQTPSDQLDQAPDQPPATDFPVLAVGTIVHERYEVTQVISESAEEHIYSVTDHQGYQHCWNCNSEQNREGDEFCIDCGAELLNAVYLMHEYTASNKNDADANTFHGNIVNTFVEEERTYAVEQVQAAENAFPTGVHLLAASDSDAGDVRRRVDGGEVVLRPVLLERGLRVRLGVELHDLQAAHRGRDFLHLRRAHREEQQIDLARLEVVGRAHHVHLGHSYDVVPADAARIEQRAHVDDHARLLHPVGRHALALQVGDRVDRRILAHPERHLKAVERHRVAQIGVGLAFPVAFAGPGLGDLADVEQQEVGLLRLHRLEDRRIAAVADDAHLQLGIVLHHLRDHRGLCMQDRARRQRREADRLRHGGASEYNRRSRRSPTEFSSHESPG